MGYGPVVNEKQKPITPFERSWAATVKRNTSRPCSVHCPHGLALDCLSCFPTQYYKTNARWP